MADQITIQSIHPEIKKAVIVFNIEGQTYPKVIPFLTTQDADLLKQQLTDFAKELKGEFDALKTAVEAADANAVPPVSDAVNALVGQPIDVDLTTPDPGTSGANNDAGNNDTSGANNDTGNNDAAATGGATDGSNTEAGNNAAGGATPDGGNTTPDPSAGTPAA